MSTRSVRDPASKIKVESNRRRHLMPTFDLHAHTCAHACTHTRKGTITYVHSWIYRHICIHTGVDTAHVHIQCTWALVYAYTHTDGVLLPPRTGSSLIPLTCLFSSRPDLSATERKHKLDPSASKLVFLQEPHLSPIHVHPRTKSVYPRTKSVHSQTGLALQSAAETPC